MVDPRTIIGSTEPATAPEPRYDGSHNVFPDAGKGDISAVQFMIPAPFAGKNPLTNLKGGK